MKVKIIGLTAVLFFAGATGAGTRVWTGAAGTGQWDDAANWSPEGVPATGDSVTISGGVSVALTNATPVLASFTITGAGTTLTMSEAVRAAPENCVTVLRAESVAIAGGAVVTHIKNSQTNAEFNAVGEWQLDGRVNIECGTLDIDAESSINANAKGYYTRSGSENNGPGGRSGGAGHGGFGANATCDSATKIVTGGAYGDMVRPVLPGSSSSIGNASTEILAGGAVKITASGIVTLEGSVKSDAGSCSGSSRHGCSGGSVWITCKAIRGSGRISADGARNTVNNANMNMGSGGRIALHYDIEEQTALDSQEGGIPALRFSANSRSIDNLGASTHSRADVGTVWCTDARFYGEEFNTDRGVAYGEINAGDWSLWNPARLKLVNAWIRIPSSQLLGRTFESIDISGCNGQLDIGGEAAYVYNQKGPGSGTTRYKGFSNSTRVYNSKERPKVTVTGDVTLSDYGFLRLSTKATNETETAEWTEFRVKGDLTLDDWAWIETPCDPTNGAACRIWADNLVIAANGGIRSDARGFGGSDNTRRRGFGPGALGLGFLDDGTAHGGCGNNIQPYGDYRWPTLPGSGGAQGNVAADNGSAGGGVIWLTLEGSCVIDGALQCNGGGQLGSSSGTGSGGSVLIVCTNGTVSGSGHIEANGGRGQFSYSNKKHGAGGRIAIHYNKELQAALGPQGLSISAMAIDNVGRQVKQDNVGFGSFYAPDVSLAECVYGPRAVQRAAQLYFDDWSGFAANGLVISNSQIRLANAPDPLTIRGGIRIHGGGLEFGGGAHNEYWNMYQYTPDKRGMDVTVYGNVELHQEARSGYTNAAYICHYGGITNGNTGVITSKYDKANKDVVVSGSIVFNGNVSLGRNSYIYPYSHPFDGGTAKLNFKNLHIGEGGGILANTTGWASGHCGWRDYGMGPGGGPTLRKAASYGGLGAFTENPSSVVYGCERLPTLPGSGAGRANAAGTTPGAGGGLIYVEVSRLFTLGGSLSANSNTGTGGTHSCGGSGGGIYVSAKTMNIADTAVISANGGNGNTNDGAVGGGGRIAIYTNYRAVNENTIAITPTVNPGTSASRKNGGVGTIYYGARPSDGFTLILR